MLRNTAKTARILPAAAMMPVDAPSAVADQRNRPTTVDSAVALVAALEADHTKAGQAGVHVPGRALRTQIEQAKQLVAFLQLKDEIEVRIPDLLERHSADAIAARSVAKAVEEKARGRAAEVDRVHDARRAELKNLKEARATALIAPTAALELAKVELGRSKVADELQNIERARAQLNEALRALEDVERGQRARDLEIDVMNDSVAQASAEAEREKRALNECIATSVAAHLQVEVVESDRATLASLLGYLRVHTAARSLPNHSFSRSFAQSTFSFYNGAHAPFCDDVSGGVLVEGWRLQKIRNATEQPSWTAFEADLDSSDGQAAEDQSMARV